MTDAEREALEEAHGREKGRLSAESANWRTKFRDLEARVEKAAEEKAGAVVAERDRLKIEAAVSRTMVEARMSPEAAEILTSLAALDDSGAVVLQHEGITVPLTAEVVAELLPEMVPAKTGGGSGGRSPKGAGPGREDRDQGVLRDFTQAEWDRMTPAQRRRLQEARIAAHGLVPR